MRKHFFRKVVLLGLFPLAVMVTGCGGGNGKAKILEPQILGGQVSCYMYGSTLIGAMAKKCCSNGSPLGNPPAGCPKAPGLNGAKSAAGGFVASAQAGQAGLSAADTMIGNSQTAGHGNNSAATAADSLQPLSFTPHSAATLPDVGLKSGPGVPKLSASKGGGGASDIGGGGGGGFGAGGITTAAATLPDTKPYLATNSDVAAYEGGGGGGRAGGGNADMGSLFGGGGNGGLGARGPDSLDFARDPAGVMNSADPENYFSMLKRSDNLFKIVERRYTNKAKNWALGDAYSAKASVKRYLK